MKKWAITHTIQRMGQDISLKRERKNHDLNRDLTFSAHTIDCVCHSIKSLFRVLGVYNFAHTIKWYDVLVVRMPKGEVIAETFQTKEGLVIRIT